MLTKIAKEGYKWRQVDMVIAYLNALIGEKKIYMAQPTGFVKNPDNVCRLLKAMYSLRESAHLWNKTFDMELRNLGFEPLIEDSCVYKHHTRALLIMYVDDTIIAAPEEDATEIIKLINKKFKTKDLGEPSMFLGCKVSRDYDKRIITISQEHYVENILGDSKMQDCKENQIPMAPAYLADAKRDQRVSEELADFAKYTGRLGWLSYKTRPDIAFAVRRLQHAQSKATKTDWTAVKTVMRYLKGHADYRLTLGKNHEEGLRVYVDAVHADAPDTRSTKGFVTMYAGTQSHGAVGYRP
jgi:Reverse transcriptase (RNA-dependent DNA polymerase)